MMIVFHRCTILLFVHHKEQYLVAYSTGFEINTFCSNPALLSIDMASMWVSWAGAESCRTVQSASEKCCCAPSKHDGLKKLPFPNLVSVIQCPITSEKKRPSKCNPPGLHHFHRTEMGSPRSPMWVIMRSNR